MGGATSGFGVGPDELVTSAPGRLFLATDPDQPEEREYQAILVMGNQEIGLPSDIVSAVWRPF